MTQTPTRKDPDQLEGKLPHLPPNLRGGRGLLNANSLVYSSRGILTTKDSQSCNLCHK
jgi:hypothetical protein